MEKSTTYNRKTLTAHEMGETLSARNTSLGNPACAESRKMSEAPEGAQMQLPYVDDSPLPQVSEREVKFPLNNLIAEIVTYDNLSNSFDYVVSHLEHAQQREKYRPLKEQYIAILKKSIGDGSFRIEKFRTLTVKDGPKARVVQAPEVLYRVGCNAIMVVVERYTYPTLIKNTAASIKGRGMHWLHQIVVEDIKADPTGMTYYYQSDIYHFYDSIDQGIMKSQVRQYISDELLLPIMDSFVELLPKGLSKGLRSSQALANLHLSEIDHKMCSVVTTHLIDSEAEDVEPIVIFKGCGVLTDKDGRQIRYHYYRYCDDVVVTAADKKSLWKVRDYLVSLLAELKLHIKPNEAVRPMTVGLDYLGYVTFLTETKHKGKVEYGVYSRVRKRTKQKFARRMVRVKSRKRRQTLIGSFYGMAAHGDCKHLLKKLLTPAEYGKLKYIKRGMRDFGDIEFTPTLIDGQKNFNGQSISGRELDHKGFIVYDFQRDVIPRREKDEYAIRLQQAEAKGMSKDLVEKPKTKYVVQIILDGKIRKMWTGDKEQWHFLEEAEQQGEIPFFSSMEVDYDGKYPKCRFCSAKKYGIPIPSDAELATLLAKLNLKTE